MTAGEDDLDCGDNSCVFAARKGGMRTNGGCRCLSDLPSAFRRQLTRHILTQRDRLKEITIERDEAQAHLGEVEQALRAVACGGSSDRMLRIAEEQLIGFQEPTSTASVGDDIKIPEDATVRSGPSAVAPAVEGASLTASLTDRGSGESVPFGGPPPWALAQMGPQHAVAAVPLPSVTVASNTFAPRSGPMVAPDHVGASVVPPAHRPSEAKAKRPFTVGDRVQYNDRGTIRALPTRPGGRAVVQWDGYGLDDDEALLESLEHEEQCSDKAKIECGQGACAAGACDVHRVDYPHAALTARVAELEAALRQVLIEHDGYHSHDCEEREYGHEDSAYEHPSHRPGERDCDCGDVGKRLAAKAILERGMCSDSPKTEVKP